MFKSRLSVVLGKRVFPCNRRTFYAGWYELLMKKPSLYTEEIVKDERMIGDYPKVSPAGFQYRDAYDHWDDVNEKRNFGEPIPYDFIAKNADAPDVQQVDPKFMLWEQGVWLGVTLGLIYASYLLFSDNNFTVEAGLQENPYKQDVQEMKKRAIQDFLKKYPAVGPQDPIADNEGRSEKLGFVQNKHMHDLSPRYIMEKQRERDQKNWN